MATDFATRTELQDLERRMEARLQLVEHIDTRFDGVQRQIRGLRNWAATAFLILLMLEIFILWRVG